MPAIHIASIEAYERKTELGGGFRGVLVDKERKDRVESPVLESREAAVYWCKAQVHERYAARGYKVASIRKRGSYRANIWVSGDSR